MTAIKHKALPYYEASVGTRPDHASLDSAVQADICVVGGGIAGCSTALHLAERGYRVVLLEAQRIGYGASGRSGGQIIPGFACDQDRLDALLGQVDARRLWDISVAAIDLVSDCIVRHHIDCDWRRGHLQVGIKARHGRTLAAWHDQLITRYDYTSTRLLNADDVSSLLATTRYRAGLFDENGGHLHPLKYTLGLAAAATQAGARLYERSPAIEAIPGSTVRIRTEQGEVRAAFAVLCANTAIGTLAPALATRILPVKTYMVATESLGSERASALIRNDCAVSDTNFILDYFRRSADHRLLFGGRVSYSGRDIFDTERLMRRRIANVFPRLKDAAIDSAWSGWLDMTVHRAPDFGRLDRNLYYLQGFSGHGVALASMAGSLVANAIAGQAERFDLFGKLPHRRFPGGTALRTPLLVLAMLWYRLRDLL